MFNISGCKADFTNLHHITNNSDDNSDSDTLCIFFCYKVRISHSKSQAYSSWGILKSELQNFL